MTNKSGAAAEKMGLEEDVDDLESESSDEDSAEEEAAEPKVDWNAMPIAEKKKLFEEYESHSMSLEEAKSLCEEASVAMSNAVKAIFTKAGHHGPFTFKGRKLTISKRGEHYYFRTKDTAAEEIG